jgi:hypothetical protein
MRGLTLQEVLREDLGQRVLLEKCVILEVLDTRPLLGIDDKNLSDEILGLL